MALAAVAYLWVRPHNGSAQAERTRAMFNVLLVVIAGISLLVGGIGIMNIMLATVTERTREIGIRRALGARRSDIIRQFLTETVALSVVGGATGILAGYACRPVILWLRNLLERVAPQMIAGCAPGSGAADRASLHPVGLRHLGGNRGDVWHLPRHPRRPDGSD